MIRRSICAAALCLIVAGSAGAQITPGTPSAAPRVDFTEAAMANTISRNLQTRGYPANDPLIQATIDRYNERVIALRDQQTAPSGGHTWMSVLRSLQTVLPWPLTVGADASPIDVVGSPTVSAGGGSFGGGGAGGTWAAPSCKDVKIELAADGALVIPSYGLTPGTAMTVGGDYSRGNCTACVSANNGSNQVMAKTPKAKALRIIHLLNLVQRPDKRDWYGTIGCTEAAGVTTCQHASVAYRNSAGAIVARATTTTSGAVGTILNNGANKNCPEGGQDGGTFHFYGDAGSTGNDNQNCTMYAPNYNLSRSGYIVSDTTSIPFAEVARWPVGSTAIPEWQRACLMDKKFLADLMLQIWKKACLTPGYNGAPCPTSIPTSDVRDGGAQVNDLGDTPSALPAADPAAPATPDPTPPGGTTTNVQDKCDFEGTANGCADPGTAAPELSEWSNIFDPILSWVPDLPSITVPSASCPTWNLDLRMFGEGGPGASDWQFVLDGHCQLVNADVGGESVASLIGNLMVAVYGIGAAVILLRA